MTAAAPTETDVLIIGAGPAGLWAAFELGLLQCEAHIVDALPMAGGQVAQLYGDKHIYDIPGNPRCTGHELVQNLLQQLRPLDVPIHLGQTIGGLQRQGQHLLVSSASQRWRCRALVIAAGVGAFVPRKLRGIDFSALEGQSVRYHAPEGECTGKRCAVYGGGEQALAAAVALCQRQATQVTLIYRRDVLQAEADTLAAFSELREQGRIDVITATVTGFVARGSQLMALDLSHPNGSSSRQQVDALWVMEGLSNQLGAISDWGLAMTRKQINIDPLTMATNEAQIYAIGDVIHTPHKRKLLVGAFHEATQAAYAIADALHPAGLGPQEYTSSSARLQKKLAQP